VTIAAVTRSLAGLLLVLLGLIACSGGGDSGSELTSPTITPEGECSARTPVLAIGDLQDPTAQLQSVDVPARLPFGVTGVRMDAQSQSWVYRQLVYVTQSPDRASEVIHDAYQQPLVPDAPSFGDESGVWITQSGEGETPSVWIRKGPAAIVLTVQAGFRMTSEPAYDRLLALAAAVDGRIDRCERWPPPVTASPAPSPAATVSIVARDNVFEPSEITVPAGEFVEFTLVNEGAAIHNMHIASPTNGRFSEGVCEGLADPCLDPFLVEPGETASLVWETPEDPLELAFRCDLHPAEMTGKLIIE
jgi:plastocyanin